VLFYWQEKGLGILLTLYYTVWKLAKVSEHRSARLSRDLVGMECLHYCSPLELVWGKTVRRLLLLRAEIETK
jgi:hypothetical protein